MRKNVLRIALITLLVLAMAIPAVMIPAMAAESVTYYYKHDFEGLSGNLTGLDDNSSEPFWHYGTWAAPSAAYISKDPFDSNNEVVRFDFKTVDTGSCGYDFVSYGDSNNPSKITWDDSTKTSGTVTVGSSTETVAVTSPDGGKTVLLNGSYLKVYSTNAELETIYGGGNVNKNLSFNNMSTVTTGTVVFELDMYLSEDASGISVSQLNGFSSLFSVSLSNSYLEPASGTWKAKLNKGAWNHISVVLDLVTGLRTFYVDYAYVGEYMPEDAYKISSITASSWIAAKIVRGSGQVGNLSGYMLLDNPNIHKLHSSETVSADAYTDSNLLSATVTTPKGTISDIMGKQALVTPGAVTVTAKYLDSTYTNGLLGTNLQQDVSIRLTNTGGIRFATNINTAVLSKLTALKDGGYIKDVSIGTMIAPLDYVSSVGKFTHAAFKSAGKTYLDVGGKVGTWYDSSNLTPSEGFDQLFVGSILNIREGNRSRNFAAVGYVKVTTLGGDVRYIYSYDYTGTANTSYDSIQNVASKLCYLNGTPTVYYQKLSDERKAMMDSFIQGKTSAGDYGSYLSAVEYTSHEFFFTNASGVACRLTFDGNNGWRLQAVKSTGNASRYNYFDDIGAGQALAKYLGETYSDITLKLSIDHSNSSYVKLTAGEDNPYVLLYKSKSLIEFYSADGVLRSDINAITADTSADTVTMKGNLATGEAVYGGGERFDAMNRRGSSMWLNISDSYNGGREGSRLYPDAFTYTGTYVAIPLFITSRGAGMYINRYEVMTVDFDTDAYNDQWCVVLDNNLMDCYFYATGRMSDALDGYTDLTGAASLPEEWAQGVMVCRYAPDLKSLEGETKVYTRLIDIPNYTTLTLYDNGKFSTLAVNATSFTEGCFLYSNGYRAYRYQDGQFHRTSPKGSPGGYGVKEIVMDMIRAGMTPTALILEPANIENTSNGSIVAQENYKKLTEMIDWLHTEADIVWEGQTYHKPAMKAMVYMGLAGMGANMPGYKTDYYLHAKIIDQDGNAYYTYNTPRRDTENPDAQGADSQSYLDITNPEAVDWFMNTVWSRLIDLGVDGVKIDFCENVLDEGTYADLTVVKGSTAPDGSIVSETIVLENATLEYLPYDDTILEGDEVHHALPSFFISMFYKAANELMEQKQIPNDFVVLSRGGGIGSQRNPYMWAGDNTREFSALSMQLRAMMSSGLSGLPFMTVDMAGYGYHYGNSWGPDVDRDYQLYCVETGEILSSYGAVRVWEGEIFTRALQYMAFTTNIQTHGDVLMVQDFTTQVQGISKIYTDLHNDLLGYIQKVSAEACTTGMPAVRHLVLNYQGDENVYDINDQFMLGDGILVAPVMESSADWTYKTTTDSSYYVDYRGNRVCKVSGATAEQLKSVARQSTYYADLAAASADPSITKTMTRSVYLPAGEWVNALTGQVIKSSGQSVSVTVAFNQIPVFLNADSKDAQSLIDNVFNGDAWQSINGGKTIADVGYTITFVDHDGTVLSQGTYAEGATVTAPAAPQRAQDNTYTYTFAGWDKTVSSTANASVTYTAVYTKTYREYTVTFTDDTGKTLASKSYHYGDTLSAPSVPNKDQDNYYTYAFSGWDNGYTGICNGAATYKATYTKTQRTYTVTFLGYDGNAISTLTLTWGQAITAPTAPEVISDAKYDYFFVEWDQEIPATCQGNATFSATYRREYNDIYDPFDNDRFPTL